MSKSPDGGWKLINSNKTCRDCQGKTSNNSVVTHPWSMNCPIFHSNWKPANTKTNNSSNSTSTSPKSNSLFKSDYNNSKRNSDKPDHKLKSSKTNSQPKSTKNNKSTPNLNSNNSSQQNSETKCKSSNRKYKDSIKKIATSNLFIIYSDKKIFNLTPNRYKTNYLSLKRISLIWKKSPPL